MADSLQNVVPGASAARLLQAGTFNAQMEAARFYREHFRGGNTGEARGAEVAGVPGRFELRVKNVGLTDLDEFAVIDLGEPLIEADANPLGALNTPVMEAVSPPSGAVDRFALTTAPIAVGKIGRAVTSGVCVALVNVTDADHEYATPAAGQTKLSSATSGPVRILTPGPLALGDVVCNVEFVALRGGGTEDHVAVWSGETSIEARDLRFRYLTQPYADSSGVLSVEALGAAGTVTYPLTAGVLGSGIVLIGANPVRVSDYYQAPTFLWMLIPPTDPRPYNTGFQIDMDANSATGACAQIRQTYVFLHDDATSATGMMDVTYDGSDVIFALTAFGGAAAARLTINGDDLVTTGADNLWTGENTFQAQAATDVPVTIQGASGQTANLTEWLDDTATVVAVISADGSFSGTVDGGTW